MRDRLIDKKLIKKNKRGHLKTEVAYNSVLLLDKKSYNSVLKSYNSVPLSVELSATKNNNRITKNNKEKSLSEKYMDKYFPKRVVDMPDLGTTYDR